VIFPSSNNIFAWADLVIPKSANSFFSAETTMHCKVTCILYKKQAHFSQLFYLQVRSVTPWLSHDRKRRCLILKVIIFKQSVILFRCSMIW
jgi:hypothetical protein